MSQPASISRGEAVRSTILEHYATGYEADRLGVGLGQLEQIRTQDIISRYLPPLPARIADVGGGPGVYAAWLAANGYEVNLLDLVPLHVEQARVRFVSEGLPRARAARGDARELPYASASQDAALLLGPMYHLPERGDRLLALREAHRVLRPGGTLIVAVISRFASLLDGYARGFIDDPRFRALVQQDLASGRHENTTNQPLYFTTAYFHHPEEVAPEVEEAGFRDIELFAVEGPFWCLPDADKRWANNDDRKRMLTFLREIEQDQSLMGVSAHILVVARKA